MKIIRLVHSDDISAILEIYRPYVEDSVITFEYTVPTHEAFTQRVEGIAVEYPYLVCYEEGEMVGYAYAHRHMEREAYQWNAELSVYLRGDCKGKGVGKALYGALLEILALQRVHNVYGCVTIPNLQSEKLHAHFGFAHVGTFPNAGYKCGAWHNVAWFEKAIAPFEDTPIPFQSIQALEREQIQAILHRFSQSIL